MSRSCRAIASTLARIGLRTSPHQRGTLGSGIIEAREFGLLPLLDRREGGHASLDLLGISACARKCGSFSMAAFFVISASTIDATSRRGLPTMKSRAFGRPPALMNTSET